jgi:hypothetical protein
MNSIVVAMSSVRRYRCFGAKTRKVVKGVIELGSMEQEICQYRIETLTASTLLREIEAMAMRSVSSHVLAWRTFFRSLSGG